MLQKIVSSCISNLKLWREGMIIVFQTSEIRVLLSGCPYHISRVSWDTNNFQSPVLYTLVKKCLYWLLQLPVTLFTINISVIFDLMVAALYCSCVFYLNFQMRLSIVSWSLYTVWCAIFKKYLMNKLMSGCIYHIIISQWI